MTQSTCISLTVARFDRSLSAGEDTSGFPKGALAANAGTETATVTRINVLLYDDQGLPRWVDAGFVENNVYPGQSVPFTISLPLAAEIEVIADIAEDTVLINGASQQTDIGVPGVEHGTIPLGGAGGYSAARLHVTSMIHEPLF